MNDQQVKPVIHKLEYMHYTSDWCMTRTADVNIDEYDYFIIQNRGSSVGDWWIEGKRRNRDYMDNLTGHGCYLREVVRFYHAAIHKIKKVDVLHWPYSMDSDTKSIKCDAMKEFQKAYASLLLRLEKESA